MRAIVNVIEVRVFALLDLEINPRAFRQLSHLQPGRVQHVEVQFRAALFALADGVHRMRRARQQDIRHDVCDLTRLLLVESALGDPRCAEADARRSRRALVAGDGIAVDHDADDIENPRRLIAAQFGSIFAEDGGTIHIQHMAIRSSKRNTQPA